MPYECVTWMISAGRNIRVHVLLHLLCIFRRCGGLGVIWPLLCVPRVAVSCLPGFLFQLQCLFFLRGLTENRGPSFLSGLVRIRKWCTWGLHFCFLPSIDPPCPQEDQVSHCGSFPSTSDVYIVYDRLYRRSKAFFLKNISTGVTLLWSISFFNKILSI